MLTFLFYLFTTVFLFIVVINFFLGWLLRSLLKGSKHSFHQSSRGSQFEKNPSGTQKKEQQQLMVACSLCNVYIPKESSLEEGGVFFCSSDHKNTFFNQGKNENN
jgi:hypothetical protein